MFEFLQGTDPFLYYLGITGVAKYALYYTWKDRVPANAELVGSITRLQLYPFKSAKGISVNELQCAQNKGAYNGPIKDRHWMVVTDKHAMISSRQEPKISVIQTQPEGPKLILSAPGFTDLVLDPAEAQSLGRVIKTDVHAVPTEGLDCGDKASRWISDLLGKPGYRVVYCGADIYSRGVIGGNNKYIPWTKVAKQEDKLAFHDSISIHLCAEESMADLNPRLPQPLDVLRFRPNIVVSTGKQAFDEDTWKHVYIGDTRLKALKLCARCVLPNVDPEKGESDKDNQPLKTLQGYRGFLPSPLGPAFGIDLIVERPGTITVGDPIYVIRGDNFTKP